MRNPSRSATVPGPIGVHESAVNPSSSSARSCSEAARSWPELLERVGAGPRPARLDPALVRRPTSFFTCGRSSGMSRSEGGRRG